VVSSAARSETGATVLRITGFEVKTGKKLAEVEDPAVTSGTVTVAAVDGTSAVLTSTSGRVWSVDYAAGRIEEDIDNLPVRAEPPLHGPVVFSPDGSRFVAGVVGEPFTTYGCASTTGRSESAGDVHRPRWPGDPLPVQPDGAYLRPERRTPASCSGT
jgi:hypothetical protein